MRRVRDSRRRRFGVFGFRLCFGRLRRGLFFAGCSAAACCTAGCSAVACAAALFLRGFRFGVGDEARQMSRTSPDRCRYSRCRAAAGRLRRRASLSRRRGGHDAAHADDRKNCRPNGCGCGATSTARCVSGAPLSRPLPILSSVVRLVCNPSRLCVPLVATMPSRGVSSRMSLISSITASGMSGDTFEHDRAELVLSRAGSRTAG